MNTKSYFLLILFLLVSQCIWAQKTYKPSKTREVHLVFADSNVVFNINIRKEPRKLNDNYFYFWYKSDGLHKNQGSFSGRLLDGVYSMYDHSKRLRTRGYFRLGLKDKNWKTWNAEGVLISDITWKRGAKSGNAKYYDDSGKLIRIVPYKRNKIHGTMIVYKGQIIDKIQFRNGIRISKIEEMSKDGEKNFSLKIFKHFKRSNKSENNKN
jgi:antitoxin component YwqK of YwqJK toxin-antitoxin module